MGADDRGRGVLVDAVGLHDLHIEESGVGEGGLELVPG
jgi:hypothetical protein